MCTNESLNNEHDFRIKWVRKFGVCRTSYTSFGKFGTPKTNGRAPKTRFLVKSVQKKYKLSNTNGPPRFTKLNYTVLWVYYTGCTRKTKKNVPLPKQLQSVWRYYCFPCAQKHASVTIQGLWQGQFQYIKNHGGDSSTSQLESIRFKYLRLK